MSHTRPFSDVACGTRRTLKEQNDKNTTEILHQRWTHHNQLQPPVAHFGSEACHYRINPRRTRRVGSYSNAFKLEFSDKQLNNVKTIHTKPNDITVLFHTHRCKDVASSNLLLRNSRGRWWLNENVRQLTQFRHLFTPLLCLNKGSHTL